MGWQLVVLAACLFLLLLAESLGQLFLQNFICEQFLFIFGCPAVQLLKTAGGAVGEVGGGDGAAGPAVMGPPKDAIIKHVCLAQYLWNIVFFIFFLSVIAIGAPTRGLYMHRCLSANVVFNMFASNGKTCKLMCQVLCLL